MEGLLIVYVIWFFGFPSGLYLIVIIQDWWQFRDYRKYLKTQQSTFMSY